MKGILWLFAYGSLLWKPGVDYDRQSPGRIRGWSRRFWQGSPDHRGTIDKPGRVVTLVPEPDRKLTGVVYRLAGRNHQSTLAYLDHRESGGYQRCWVNVDTEEAGIVRALTYVALPGNPHYLGPTDTQSLRRHIERSTGPSGHNLDYHQNLMDSLSRLDLTPGELLDVAVTDLISR